MRLVGVTGKSGSGKTTFSDILAQNENIGVIHIDELLKELKLKYFKRILQEDKNGERIKVNSKLKTILYKNKILFNIFMRIRAKLIEKRISQEIDRLQEQGKKVILIDDIFLQYQKCYKDISLVFFMERPFVSRINSLMEREQMSKQEIVAYDIAHTSGNYKQKYKNVIKIDNDKGQEDLIVEADRIYTYNFAPLRKRCRVNNYGMSQNNSPKEKTPKNREEEEK